MTENEHLMSTYYVADLRSFLCEIYSFTFISYRNLMTYAWLAPSYWGQGDRFREVNTLLEITQPISTRINIPTNVFGSSCYFHSPRCSGRLTKWRDQELKRWMEPEESWWVWSEREEELEEWDHKGSGKRRIQDGKTVSMIITALRWTIEKWFLVILGEQSPECGARLLVPEARLW